MRRNMYDGFDYTKAANWLFEYLCELAKKNERCPSQDDLCEMHRRLGHPITARNGTHHMRALIADGRVSLRLESRWRIVTILVGELAGKSTKVPEAANAA